ncbi:MAG: tyrosine-type recombinase/integrase, partial [Oscillospiraceae bacterium]
DLVDRSLKRIINKYNESPDAKESGVFLPHFSVHTFRHTFATRMFESGVDPRVTQAILGHSSLNITLNVYTDISLELRQKGASELDKHLSKFTPIETKNA